MSIVLNNHSIMMTPENPNPRIKILIVDDDKKLCRLVGDYLAPMGYEVDAAHTGTKGLELALARDYHAVILDIMMPGMDGLELLKELRRQSDVPVLMLTARGDETDRIVGLELGADDYLPKTFSTRELLARLRAVTRRSLAHPFKSQSRIKDETIILGDLEINKTSHMVRLEGEPLSLTALEFDLLASLAEAAGRVLSRDQSLDPVSGRSYDVFDRSIDVHISSLRKKLRDDSKQPKFIKTIRSVGYMFVDPAHPES